MNAFAYRRGVLHADDVRLDRLADAVGTPCWVYSARALEQRYREFADSFRGLDALVCYSLKANSNQAVIATLARLGAGADVVSGGEMRRALAAGIPADKIVFAGVGKTADEMNAALKAGIRQFNVESEPELRLLSRTAAALRKRAPVVLRVNPDVDAKTHAKITTGKKENKFGVDIDLAPRVARLAAELPGIDFRGLAVHIGSQLTSVEPFAAAFQRLAELSNELIAAGVPISRLDFGGGLGVNYRGEQPPPISWYADAVRSSLDLLPKGGKGVEIVLAPGRWLIAEAGALLTRVIYVKSGTAKRFLIVDGAMNDLLRPAMYDAFHPMRPVVEHPETAAQEAFDVVGPVCETGDLLAAARPLPVLATGDLLAIEVAGAYGAVMSSTYNARTLAPEVLVRGAKWAVVRPRQTIESLIGLDRLPPWLQGGKKAPARKPSARKKQAKKRQSRGGKK